MANKIGDITLGPGYNDIVVSGFSRVASYPVNKATLIAHPSNTGILYVRARGGAGSGYPLTAGATLALDSTDLYGYTASGVAAQRLAYVIST